MNFFKDMDPLTMTLILLGLINTTNNMTKINTNSDLSSDLGKRYTDKTMSKWLLSQIKKSEGLRETAYTANTAERLKGQWTIGYGTSFLFDFSYNPINTKFSYGKIVNGANGVYPGLTLDILKTKYLGLPITYSSSLLAEQLIFNYSMSNLNSAYWLMQKMEQAMLPYFEVVKDVLIEFGYGSGRIKELLNSSDLSYFIDSVRLKDKNEIAKRYYLMRYKYYKNHTGNLWLDSSNRISWLKRVYSCAMHVKGIEIKNPDSSLGYSSNRGVYLKNFENVVLRDLGIFLPMNF